jgi:hypothetical protein
MKVYRVKQIRTGLQTQYQYSGWDSEHDCMSCGGRDVDGDVRRVMMRRRGKGTVTWGISEGLYFCSAHYWTWLGEIGVLNSSELEGRWYEAPR